LQLARREPGIRITRQLPQRSLRSLASRNASTSNEENQAGWTYLRSGASSRCSLASSLRYVGNRLTLYAIEPVSWAVDDESGESRKVMRGFNGRSLCWTFPFVLAGLTACQRSKGDPRRVVDAILLTDRSNEDTISPIISQRHAAMLKALRMGDARVADYVAPSFVFEVAPVGSEAWVGPLKGLKPLDYYAVINGGIRADVLVPGFKVQVLGEHRAVVTSQISPTVSSLTSWSHSRDGWRATRMQVWNHKPIPVVGPGPIAS
jgi:hypothetical protein